MKLCFNYENALTPSPFSVFPRDAVRRRTSRPPGTRRALAAPQPSPRPWCLPGASRTATRRRPRHARRGWTSKRHGDAVQRRPTAPRLLPRPFPPLWPVQQTCLTPSPLLSLSPEPSRAFPCTRELAVASMAPPPTASTPSTPSGPPPPKLSTGTCFPSRPAPPRPATAAPLLRNGATAAPPPPPPSSRGALPSVPSRPEQTLSQASPRFQEAPRPTHRGSRSPERRHRGAELPPLPPSAASSPPAIPRSIETTPR